MGRGGTDTNAVDFFSDGSGSGNCYSGNVSSTFDPGRRTRLEPVPGLSRTAAARLGHGHERSGMARR